MWDFRQDLGSRALPLTRCVLSRASSLMEKKEGTRKRTLNNLKWDAEWTRHPMAGREITPLDNINGFSNHMFYAGCVCVCLLCT